MTVEWGWEKWTQTIFSILFIKQTTRPEVSEVDPQKLPIGRDIRD